MVDSEPNYFEADIKVLAEYGVNGYDRMMKKKYIGMGIREMMEELIEMYNIDATAELLTAKKSAYYCEIAKGNTVVFPEMLKFLRLLKQNNYPIALASGSSSEVIDMILSVTDLSKYFDVVLSSDVVEKGKPAPDLFLETARQLGVHPENCLVVEDSQYGVEAAKRAFMYCIGIPDPVFETMPDSFNMADLLYKEGICSFSAEKAFQWVKSIG